ncbi:MAG: hypothetical protein ACP5RJ_06265 [Conexivisphaera sp.]|uniref:SoxA A3 domain-containing protein n=1 Tax=Conexivisphaera calida TaxID=1874277 RepID=A0A4P2VCJ4_9ARCH|nr:hypothetical protein [Conexivisphaera calida]MDP7982524.1 hypothetical protein [Conexivisphaerales archaeon]BBE41841.1 hypothetical protein NAS2_0452 [Conexivisphaera calida]
MSSEQPTIICRCMDRTQEDMVNTFRFMVKVLGVEAADINNYRRFSAATTGFCQGRGCLSLTQRVYVSEMKKLGVDVSMDELRYRVRSPLQPVPLGVFAKSSIEEV